MRLRAETTVTVTWIADRLQMGAPGYVNLLSHRQRKEGKAKYANLKNPFMSVNVGAGAMSLTWESISNRICGIETSTNTWVTYVAQTSHGLSRIGDQQYVFIAKDR